MKLYKVIDEFADWTWGFVQRFSNLLNLPFYFISNPTFQDYYLGSELSNIFSSYNVQRIEVKTEVPWHLNFSIRSQVTSLISFSSFPDFSVMLMICIYKNIVRLINRAHTQKMKLVVVAGEYGGEENWYNSDLYNIFRQI